LVPEPGHTIAHQIRAHHAFAEAGLESLVNHVPACLEVGRQALDHTCKWALFGLRPTLGVTQAVEVWIELLDPPHADATVPPVLLEYPRAEREPTPQLDRQLLKRVDPIAVSTKRQVAYLHQDILRAHAQNRVGVGAHQHATSRHPAQHRVQHVSRPAAFDRIVPHQHDSHSLELRFDLRYEVITVDSGFRAHAGGIERGEQGRKATRGRIGALSRRSVARIENRHRGGRASRHVPAPRVVIVARMAF
jgi:hypothetical protein